jgi:PIN domain nuclease of toxin-antitoxin system
MDVGERCARAAVSLAARALVILLDTNALIWLQRGHRRSRPLGRVPRMYISPVSVLELQFLVEAGKLRLAERASLSDITSDSRWALDEPPSARWFSAAAELSWTRDPFDRLIVAHARLRGWKLATGDDLLIEGVGPANALAL